MRNDFEKKLKDEERQVKYTRQKEYDELLHNIKIRAIQFGFPVAILIVAIVYVANNTFQTAYEQLLSIAPIIRDAFFGIVLDRLLFRK